MTSLFGRTTRAQKRVWCS